MGNASIDQTLLSTCLEAPTRTTIVDEFWGNLQSTSFYDAEINLDVFWTYYIWKCSHALQDNGRHVAVRTHRDIISVVQYIRAGADREDIREKVRHKLTRTHNNEEEMLDNTIKLATSLLLMCDCGSSSYSFSGMTVLDWTRGSLLDHLAMCFSGKPTSSHGDVKMDKTFIASNLTLIAGIEIVWTDNLLDHLRLTNDDTKVHIFYHASFLEQQIRR